MGGDMDGKGFPRTVLLVGRTGNGKSSTGNSVIGKSVFKSEMSFTGVTRTLDCQTVIFPDGRVLNVIDTPGLFDFHVGSEFIKKEIMKCIELAEDGTHAVILVLSLRARFTEEEAAAIQNLSTLFGPSITDYMIILFTGDDYLEKDMSREEYLQKKTPSELQEILRMCKNRTVFFDNETVDEEKKILQLTKLLSLVDKVLKDNGGQPYTDCLFKEFEEAAMLQQLKEAMNASTEQSKHELIELTKQIQSSYDEQLKGMTEMEAEMLQQQKKAMNAIREHLKELIELTKHNQSSYDEQLKRMTEMVESKLRETNERLQEQLANEREARKLLEIRDDNLGLLLRIVLVHFPNKIIRPNLLPGLHEILAGIIREGNLAQAI